MAAAQHVSNNPHAAAELLFAVKHAGFSWAERNQTEALDPGVPVDHDEPPIARCEVAPPVACTVPSAAAAAAPSAVEQSTMLQHISPGDDIMLNEVVSALKRKLIELESERLSTVRRMGLLEQELIMEKREHQRTTVKLSQILAKRSTCHNREGAHESELASLRRAVTMLKQELAVYQQQAKAMAPAAALDGLGMKRDLTIANMENAAPRLQRPRHAEGLHSPAADLSSSRASSTPSTSSDRQPTDGGLAPIGMVRSVSTTLRTPHGYVEGAICVEAPRRQRVRTSSAMPRSASSTNMSKSLSGIPLSRSPTAPAALEGGKQPEPEATTRGT
mmetsp:Transcript_14088/g.20039  ORF Transcript_14088/g.20039 Transcript_14088/m.20039 type:complete len:332 (+) Transcript_14088:54-1049(+)